MGQFLFRCLGVAAAALLVAACSSTAEKPQPAPLPTFSAQLQVSKAWSAKVGEVSTPLSVAVLGQRVAVASTTGDLALIDALQSQAFYVGAIGSRRNSALRHARLHEHFDLPEETLQKLHGPAGLCIGSKTPAEIALSIMAEVVAVKNGAALKTPHHMVQTHAEADAIACGASASLEQPAPKITKGGAATPTAKR